MNATGEIQKMKIYAVLKNSIFFNVSSWSLLNAAGKGLSSLGLSLARLAAELIACPLLASCAFKLSVWKLLFCSTPQGIMHVFFHLEIPCKTCKTFCFLFHQSAAICTFLSKITETSVFSWSEPQQALYCRCGVTLSILLFSVEST